MHDAADCDNSERRPLLQNDSLNNGTLEGAPALLPTPLLINAKAASQLLGISPRKLWSLTNCNAIPSRRIGNAIRYAPVELEAWIASGCPTEAGAGVRVRKSVAA